MTADRETEMHEALLGVTVSLVAAISLLKRGSKRVAPSDKMFDAMITDYERAVARAQRVLHPIGE